MASIIDGERRSLTPVVGYLAVLIVALVIVVVATTMWLSTDDSGTNVLATDAKSVTRVP
jgi:hypothetical protein